MTNSCFEQLIIRTKSVCLEEFGLSELHCVITAVLLFLYLLLFIIFQAEFLCIPIGSAALADGPPFPAESFDKILLDAPCSALGQRPSLSNPISSKELASYPSLQRKLLSAAVKLLRRNGTLVYSTCTFTSGENEDQIGWLLERYKEMRLLPQV